MTDQTIIEQVARLDERIAEHRAHIAKIEAEYGSGKAKLDERCAGIVLGFDQVLDLRTLLATLQPSAVLPSEAITSEMRFAGRKAAMAYRLGGPNDDALDAIYTAMRAATPTAPVQDDDAECPSCGSKLWTEAHGRPDDLVRCKCTIVSLEWLRAIASRLSPTPETGLVEALERALRIRIWNECKERGMRDADAYKRIEAEIAGVKTESLSNVSRLED
jgi:hypothetical protein